jgi:hypothetical protein
METGLDGIKNLLFNNRKTSIKKNIDSEGNKSCLDCKNKNKIVIDLGFF